MWRFIRNPTSLCGRVLKESYFCHGNIFKARGGSNASYIWRSLLWGREIIMKGYRWRVGNGNNIRVLQDPWLPRPHTFKIFEHPEILNDLYVSDLKWENGQWDADFISKVFTKEDSELILSLHSEDPSLEDKMMWQYSKDGEYSVKSGYKIACNISKMSEAYDMSGT